MADRRIGRHRHQAEGRTESHANVAVRPGIGALMRRATDRLELEDAQRGMDKTEIVRRPGWTKLWIEHFWQWIQQLGLAIAHNGQYVKSFSTTVSAHSHPCYRVSFRRPETLGPKEGPTPLCSWPVTSRADCEQKTGVK